MANLVTKHAFCSLPGTKAILNGDGNLSHCCYQLEQLGSILGDKSVLDLWNSPKAKAIRRETAKGNLHPVCKSWNSCPFQVIKKTVHPFAAYEDFEYPTHLEICLPNFHCNIGGENPSPENPACIMCRRNFDYKKQPAITEILCEKAKPLMPYLRVLYVLGIAEPFWRDAVFNVFSKIGFSDHKHHIQFSTNTNVICLTEKVIERFFDEVAYSDISFSIDAGTPETFQKIRRLDSYHIVLRNLKYYMIHRDRNGGRGKHQTVIYNNINMLNVAEMSKMVETAADLRVDKMIMLPTHDQCGSVALGEILLNQTNIDVFKSNAEAAKKRAEQLGVNLHYSKPFDVIPPPVGQELPLVQIKMG